MNETEKLIRTLRFDEMKAQLRLRELARTGLTLQIESPDTDADERAKAIAWRKQVDREWEQIKAALDRDYSN